MSFKMTQEFPTASLDIHPQHLPTMHHHLSLSPFLFVPLSLTLLVLQLHTATHSFSSSVYHRIVFNFQFYHFEDSKV